MQTNFVNTKLELYFLKEFENIPQDGKLINRLRNASATINTNAFQILYRISKSDDVNIRAFYPIDSLMNHHCTPNTRRNVDGQFISHVSATQKILKDEEIFTSYSQLLWGTYSRRMHLMASKQFLCSCDRCIDSSERKTNISAIKCQDKKCCGMVLPIVPINFRSVAKCSKCGEICENKRYLQIQEIASSMVRNILAAPKLHLLKLADFLETKLKAVVPSCSQFVIEAKLGAIWKCNESSLEGENLNSVQTCV